MAARVLEVLCAPRAPQAPEPPAADHVEVTPVAESIRRSGAPTVRGAGLLKVAAQEVTPLSGTAAGEMDPGVLLPWSASAPLPRILLGQDRHRRRRQPLGPAGLGARRGIRIATELDLPLVTVVDTARASLSREAEEGGWPARSPGASPISSHCRP